MQTAICNGVIEIISGSVSCSGSWTAAEYLGAFDPATLDASAVLSAFAAGFTLVSIPMAVILGGRLFLSSIKGDSK